MSTKTLSDQFREIDQIAERLIRDLDRLTSILSRMGGSRIADSLRDIVPRVEGDLVALREFTRAEEDSDKTGKKQVARTEEK